MTVDLGFSTKDIELESGRLEPGAYKVLIKSYGKEMSKNDIPMLVVQYEVVEGDSKGKTIKDYFNFWHDSEQVRNIAKQSLKKLSVAVETELGDPAINPQGKVLEITVKEQKDSDYTQVSGYKKVDD